MARPAFKITPQKPGSELAAETAAAMAAASIAFRSTQAQIGEISEKRTRVTSAYEQQGGKLTLQLAWLAGKELVTIPRY